jgi:hypothetical protein
MRPLAATLAALIGLASLALPLAPPAHAAAPPAAAAAAATAVATGTLVGRVTDGGTGEPLPGATVALAGTRYGAAADAEGRYRIVAPAGVYTVEARMVGYAVRRVEGVEVADDETLPLDLALEEESLDLDEVVVEHERPIIERDAVGAARTTTGDGRTRGEGTVGATAGAPAPPPGAAPTSEESFSVDSGPEDRAAPEPVRPGRLADEGRRGDPFGQPRSGLLTAGDVDDHLNFAHFLRYIRRELQRDPGQTLPAFDLDDRVTVVLRDRDGRPASNARVRVVPTDRRGRTAEFIAGTDGRLHLYPARDLGRGVRRVRLEVRPPSGGAAHVERLDLAQADEPVEVRLPVRAALPAALDLAVVLDVTGSMGDEHRYLSDEFEAIVARVRRRYPQVDLRFALVAYRDHGDDFVVRSYGFTTSVREMQQRLAEQSAGGGGDWPEAVPEALEAALALDWRGGNTARVLFHVADAPPHDGDFDETMAHVAAARAAGIRIYPVAASGATGPAEYLMRTEAALTQGRYLFLTDDSGIGNAHDEPKVACYVVTALDRQIERAVAGELAGRRVEPDRQDVVREVGRYDGGVCLDQPVTYVPQGQGRW